jgi:hypothetical protein
VPISGRSCWRAALLGPALGLANPSLPPPAQAAHSAPVPPRLERLDDAPASPGPTRTAPGARPEIGSFTHVQVNVAGVGINILGDAANEPSIAVDPRNPNHMAIGWRQFDTVTSNFREAGRAWTVDGGHTWTFAGVLTNGVFRSDPVLTSDADGVFYYSSLESSAGVLTTDIFVSTDGGVGWFGPHYSYGGDKQWITVDRTTNPSRGTVYQAWSTAAGCCGTSVFNRSFDGGLGWSVPVQMTQSPRWGTMQVGAAGELYLVGVGTDGRIKLARSVSAKEPAFMPFFEQVVTVPLGGGVRAGDGFTGPNPAGLLGQLWVGYDDSGGPRAGWLYVVGSVDPPGTDPMDVMFSRSTDGGLTWSPAQRLNDDPSGAWQWFGTMSVAPNGRIDVVWNDTRNSGLENVSELFYVSSSDGGATWSPNQPVSPPWDSWLGWPQQDKIGDYYHMVSDRVGASLAWAATFNGEQDVWFLRIGDRDCNNNGIGDSEDIASGTSNDWNHTGIPDECEGFPVSVAAGAPSFRLLQNTPNPFNPTTRIAFELPAGAGRARLQIFDVAGRPVRALPVATTAGTGAAVWDGRDADGRAVASGVYVCRLTAGSQAATRRMLLVR